MKSILFSIFLIYVSLSYAQISRGVQSKQATDFYCSSGIIENTDIHQYKISKKYAVSTDSMLLENIVYDKIGEVKEINYFKIPYSQSYNLKILGVHQKSPNVHLIHVLCPNQLNQIYVEQLVIEFNTLTNTVVQTSILNLGLLNRNFSQSLTINGNIVNYVVKASGGLYRISFSPQNLSTLSEELVDSQVTGNSTNSVSGLGLCNRGLEEFISCSFSQKLYKRTGPNSYINSISLPIWFSSQGTSSAALSQKIMVSYGQRYCIFNNNLDTLQTGKIVQQTIGQLNVGLVAKDNKFFALLNTTITKLNEFDEDGQLLDSIIFEVRFKEGFFMKLDNSLCAFTGVTGNYFGTLTEGGIAFPNSTATLENSSIVFLTKDLSSASELSDFGNKIKASELEMVSSNAFQLGTANSQNGVYHIKNGKKTSLVYSLSNNFVGLKNSNVFGDYGVFYNNFYQYGPYTNANDYDWKLQSKYTRGFFVTNQMIQDHIDSLQTGSSNYIPEQGIRDWPAHGNTSIGQAANVAAFVDVNGNGTYEPLNGDYPKIYGDECLFTIGHMASSTDLSSETEIHSYRFNFLCDTSDLIKKTIFQKNLYIPRSLSFDTVFIGTYADFDIGAANDDYCGTNVELGLIYGYNGDAFDDINSYSNGFGDTIPAMGVLTLQGVKQINDGLDNASGIGASQTINGIGFGDQLVDNEYWGLTASKVYTNGSSYPYSDPNNVIGNFYSSQGLYLDGTDQGTEGYSYSVGVPHRHAFFGNSDPLFYSSNGVNHGNNLSEVGALMIASDRRITGASGPGELNLGDTMVTLNAYFYAIDKVNISPQNSVNKLFQEASLLKSYFAANDAGCGNTFGTIQEDLKLDENVLDNIKLYPNPAQTKFYVVGLEEKSKIELIDMKGVSHFVCDNVESKVEIDLKDLANGIYFVRISSDTNIVLKKVIKN